METKNHIDSIIKEHKPDIIAVEDFIRFMKKGSSASTIIPLATLNRTICLLAQERYSNIPLKICNVISIRTMIKKDSNLTDLPDKKQLPTLLSKLMTIEVPILTKQTRKGERLLDETFDQADAIAVAYYTYRKTQE